MSGTAECCAHHDTKIAHHAAVLYASEPKPLLTYQSLYFTRLEPIGFSLTPICDLALLMRFDAVGIIVSFHCVCLVNIRQSDNLAVCHDVAIIRLWCLVIIERHFQPSSPSPGSGSGGVTTCGLGQSKRMSPTTLIAVLEYICSAIAADVAVTTSSVAVSSAPI